MSTSPTARSLAALRAEGYLAAVVERRLPRGFITQDLFGVADLIAVRPGSPVLLVQCTSSSNAAARVAKVLASEALPMLLSAGVAVEVWGWSLKGAKGKRKLWQLTRRAITLADLSETINT